MTTRTNTLSMPRFGTPELLFMLSVCVLIVVVAYWLITFPLAWLLGIHWGLGPRGPWIGLIAGLSVAAVLLNLRFWRLSARLG